MSEAKYEPVAYKAAREVIARLTLSTDDGTRPLLEWIGAHPEQVRLLDWIEAHPVRVAELLWERSPFEFDPKGEIIYGHTDENTAYVVDDYPYGRDRTLMRYWLEYKKNRGYRFVSQTLNPKTKRWNNPHASTYDTYLLMLRLFSDGHIHSTRPISYSPLDTIRHIRAYGQSYRPEVWGEIKGYLLAGMGYSLQQIKHMKKTGNTGLSINGVPQKAKMADFARPYENLLEYALAIALTKWLDSR